MNEDTEEKLSTEVRHSAERIGGNAILFWALSRFTVGGFATSVRRLWSGPEDVQSDSRLRKVLVQPAATCVMTDKEDLRPGKRAAQWTAAKAGHRNRGARSVAPPFR